jgi:hypothetical protein
MLLHLRKNGEHDKVEAPIPVTLRNSSYLRLESTRETIFNVWAIENHELKIII